MDSKIPLANRNVFLVGGITHVPEHEYPDHIRFMMQVANMLRFRYEMNPSFALLDNEIWLREVPREKRAIECYRIDQASVDWAGLVVADLSVPSTGTGQELERAYNNGTPVILMAKEEMRKEVTPIIEYYTERKDGNVEKHRILRGTGNISLMVEGNPSVVQPAIIYSNDGNIGRTEALRRLDDVLQKRFGLVPITIRLEKAMGIDAELLEALERGEKPEGLGGADPEPEKRRIRAQLDRMGTMRDMADSLLTFSPSKYDPKQYEAVFGFIKRVPLADVEKGLNTATHVDIRPTHPREQKI